MRRRVAIAAALLVPAAAASAQTGPVTTPKIELSIDVGAQGWATSFGDSFEVPVNQEQERISVQYPDREGTFTAVAGRYQVWKQLTVGAGVTHFARNGAAAVHAKVPHPFFDNQFRSVDGTAATRCRENGLIITAGWRIPLSHSMHIVVSGGPAIVQVKRALVTGVKVTEEYPYDTATFASADVSDASRAGAGLYAGADVTWLFSRHLGAGGVLQFTHGRVRLQTGDRRVSVDAGGFQAGGGARLVF